MSDIQNTTIHNSGTVVDQQTNWNAENVNISELHDYDFHQESSPELVEIDVAAYQSDHYLAPSFTGQLETKLSTNKLLIIAGGQGFDKGDLILHLASRLKAKQPAIKVRELQDNLENKSVLTKLRALTSHAIVLFQQMHPRHFEHNFQKLQQIVAVTNHTIIITTDVELQHWQIPEYAVKDFWFEVPDNKRYTSTELEQYFIRSFERRAKSIDFVDFDISAQSRLSFGWTIQKVNLQFSAPTQIDLFIGKYAQFEEQPDDKQLEKTIRDLQSTQEPLTAQWFRNLSHRNKLIALAGVLLEGSYDDQFFSATNEMVADFWGLREESLKALDYCDLEFMMQFFRFEELTPNQVMLVAKYSNYRPEIIAAAWSSYRRHILAAFPKLLSMTSESLARKTKNWERYGTRARRMRLRQVIGSTISDIGLVSVQAIESTLLELAANSVYSLQIIAAKAMARWREFDRDDLLFSTLSRWNNDEQVEGLISEFLDQKEINLRQAGLSGKSSAYIKSTAVMTLAYAADYDAPNQLSANIISLLKDLVRDQDPLVYKRINKALPKIIHHHSLQLKDTLMNDFMIYPSLADAIGEGLARAYKDYPSELKTMLESWLAKCLVNSSEENRRTKFTQRDNVLATVLATFKSIEYTLTGADVITIDEVYAHVIALLKSEGRRSVRQLIIEHLAFLHEHDFERAFEYADQTLSHFSKEERHVLIVWWGQVYLQQRQNLQGAPYFKEVNGVIYPIWTNMIERPLTAIEQAMFKWINSNSNLAREFATLAFFQFTRVFEHNELIYIAEIQEQEIARSARNRDVSAAARRAQVNANVTPEHRLGFWIQIRIFFMTLSEPPERRKELKALVKLCLNTGKYNIADLKIVVWKWQAMGNDTSRKFGRWLRRCFKIT